MCKEQQGRATTLSLCMIARNEGERIGRSLESVQGVVDEIIVIDTGSSDHTAEIASALGARVFFQEWRGDFSFHRNASLEKATGKWIIFLDADEELAPESIPELLDIVRKGEKEAYYVLVRNLLGEGMELTSHSIRLFRNRECFRFLGRIHEQIVPSIIKYGGHECIGHSSVAIIHHGYHPDNPDLQAKIQRNLDILLSYSPEEQDGFFFYNLGTEYFRRGDKKEALRCYLQALKLTSPAAGYGPILVQKTIATLMELQRFRDALEQLSYYRGLYPEYRDLVYLEGMAYFRSGFYSRACSTFGQFLQMPLPLPFYPSETGRLKDVVHDLRERLKPLCGKPQPLDLSVCIIARDEAGSISEAIRSVNEIAREVVVVDTGSVDKTAWVAYQLGARIYRYSWEDDFSAARNFALEQATGEWVLFLDADETLSSFSRQQLQEMLPAAKGEGCWLKVRTFLEPAPLVASSQLRGSCRLLHRKSKNYHYCGAVEEDIVSSIETQGGEIRAADIEIEHWHYRAAEKQLKRKREWKRRAIEKRWKDDPLRLKFALGAEAFYHRDFATAAELLAEATGPAELIYFKALALINLRRVEEAREVLERSIPVWPDYTDLLYLKALACFLSSRQEEAEQLFKNCLEMGEASWQRYLVNSGTGSFKAMCSLATLYGAQGKMEEAFRLLQEAGQLPGGLEVAVETAVRLMAGTNMLSFLFRFLEEGNMLNGYSMCVAAKALGEIGRYKESLDVLIEVAERLKGSPDPASFTLWLRSVDFLTEKFGAAVKRLLPAELLVAVGLV